MNLEEIERSAENYLLACQEVHKVILKSGVKQVEIQKELELSKAQYYRRIRQEQLWPPEELLKLCNILRAKRKGEG